MNPAGDDAGIFSLPTPVTSHSSSHRIYLAVLIFALSLMLAVVVPAYGGPTTAVGTYCTDEAALAAHVRNLAESDRELPVGLPVADLVAAVVAELTLSLTLYPDGGVGVRTATDEYFRCGSWGRDGRRIHLRVHLTGELSEIEGQLDRAGLRLCMPLFGRTVELPMRRRE